MFSASANFNATILSISKSIMEHAKSKNLQGLIDIDKENKSFCESLKMLDESYKHVCENGNYEYDSDKYKNHSLYAYSIIYSIIELAKEGDLKSIIFLKPHLDIDMNIAVYGFSLGGHIKIVNQLIGEGADPKGAVQGYKAGGYFDQDRLFNILACTDDTILKEMLVKSYLKETRSLFKKGIYTANQYFNAHHELEKYLRSKINVKKISNEAKKEIPDEILFNKFCRLITEKNRIALAKLFAEGSVLHVAYGKYASPLVLFAEKNDYDSINFMDKYFPDYVYNDDLVRGWALNGNTAAIDERVGKMDCLESKALGYAEGGYISLAEDAVKLGASLRSLVYGYALARNIEQVQAVLNRKDLNTEQLQDLLGSAAVAYSLSADPVNALKMHEELGRKELTSVVYRLASGNHVEEVNEILDNNPESELQDCAVFGYTFSELTGNANAIFEKNNKIKAIDKYWFFSGYADGNHFDEAEKYISLKKFSILNKMKNIISSIYSSPMFPNQADQSDTQFYDVTCEEENEALIEIAEIYANNKCIKRLDKLFNQISPDNFLDFSKAIVKRLNENKMLIDEKDILKILSVIDTSAFRNQIAELINRTDLLKEATSINEMRNEYNLNFIQVKSLHDIQPTGDNNDKVCRAWFIICFRHIVMKQKILTCELYLHISTYLTGLDLKNTKILAESLHNNFFAYSTKNIYRSCKQGLFSQEKYLAAHRKIEIDNRERFEPNYYLTLR